MYDKYGWIIHFDRFTCHDLDVGDSCFFMGIQAVLYGFWYDKMINCGKTLEAAVFKRRALDLYEKCAEVNFMRHPTINDTSYDMMAPWDYFCARWEWVPAPPYEYRPSAYWTGRHRGAWMYDPLIVMATLLFRAAFPITGRRCYMSHLLALRAAACYYLTGDLAVLRLFRWWVTCVEKKLGYPNAFFRRLALMLIPKESLARWGDGIVEWEYQRDRALKEVYKRQYTIYTHTEFHQESIPGAGFPESRLMTFAEQFGEVANG